MIISGGSTLIGSSLTFTRSGLSVQPDLLIVGEEISGIGSSTSSKSKSESLTKARGVSPERGSSLPLAALTPVLGRRVRVRRLLSFNSW